MVVRQERKCVSSSNCVDGTSDDVGS
jgi:hypothetical protein